jgi:hypothetical protein
MTQTLNNLCWLFWISLFTSAISAGLTYVIVWRRPLWLQILNAEESFWKRIGVPKMSFDKGFGQSRFFALSFVFFTIVLLLLAIACAVLYFHFQHR